MEALLYDAHWYGGSFELELVDGRAGLVLELLVILSMHQESWSSKGYVFRKQSTTKQTRNTAHPNLRSRSSRLHYWWNAGCHAWAQNRMRPVAMPVFGSPCAWCISSRWHGDLPLCRTSGQSLSKFYVRQLYPVHHRRKRWSEWHVVLPPRSSLNAPLFGWHEI